MKKVFLGSGHELGSVVSTRSSNFEPVENYIEIISEFEDSYESTDVSGVVGLGLDLPLGFRVDGRYNFGLTELLPDVKNNVFSLSIGWTII